MNKKKLFPLALVPLATTSLQAQSNIQTGRTDKRPNIILFMVDDMGWQDTSLPFWTQKTHYNELYETPNMERLARQGMMFTQAYASSISSPTRCSLITGTNAARHRVTNWTLQKNTMTDRKDKQLAVPDWNYNGVSQVPGTNNTFVGTSFVQILKDNGYHTIHCGKAHFGSIDTPGEDPHHWGFEVNIAGHAAGGLASYLGEENYGHTKDGKPVSLMAVPGLEKYWGTETFVTEALTQEAIKALNKAKKYNQPFYLYMAQYAIHVPLNKDMRFYDKYKKKGMTDHEAAYATLIEGMDKSLGDLMNWLEKNDEADNTIIIFMSDGYPTDNWEKALQKITDKENGNKWFQYSTKIAFALGRDADAKTLSQIVGNKEAVIQTSDLETFKKMIKVVSASSVLTNSVSRPQGQDTSNVDIVKNATGEKQASNSDQQPAQNPPEPDPVPPEPIPEPGVDVPVGW